MKEKLKDVGCIVWAVAAFCVPALIGWGASRVNVLFGFIVGIVGFVVIVYGSYKILDQHGVLDIPSPEGTDYYEEY